MEGKRLILTLSLKDFLSYGPDGMEIGLEPLNVLIGPNSSGKSNLIEAINVLRSTPKDLTAPIREGGGVSEWLWKGRTNQSSSITAEIGATVDYPQGTMPLRYRLRFTSVAQRLEIVDEAIENAHPTWPDQPDVYFFYRFQDGHPALNVRKSLEEPAGTSAGRAERRLQREDVSPDQSVLSQRKDPDVYPELTYLGNQFAGVRIYTDWSFGRYTAPRMPQPADAPVDFLSENGSNLGLVLNSLQNSPGAKRLIEENLRKFYPNAEDINPRIYGGTVQVFVLEKGLDQPVPATRLSDGTLRFLCLLTLLCHPSPPPLICIEEPELGLHPDILPTLAKLLIEASQRTQIVVTTHSDTLVSALADVPESIIVCDRDESGSHLRRLHPDQLKDWLKDCSLGELWLSGELGGTRW